MMFSRLAALLAVMPSAFAAKFPYFRSLPQADLSLENSFHRRDCGTPPPDQHLRKALETFNGIESREDNDLWSAATFSSRVLNKPLHKREPLITIPLYMHVVSTQNASSPTSDRYASDIQLQNQFDYLRSAYANISISFNLINTSRTINDRWAAGLDELSMKQTLRRGTYGALNLYIQSDLVSYDDQGNPTNTPVLGVCTLPITSITTTSTPNEYVYDGCHVISTTLPGGSTRNYNLGGTAAHEVGHWFGLLHTFEDQSCSATSWGDYIADTPQQLSATTGCPPRGTRDTCPNSGQAPGWNGVGANPYNQQGYAGPDNTRNFMDYSTDVCYEGFSPGQAARMINAFNLFRLE